MHTLFGINLGALCAIGYGVIFLLTPFSATIRRYIYHTSPEPKRNRRVTIKELLLGLAFILVGVIIWLQSFGDDTLTIVSLVLVALCAIFALIGLAIPSSDDHL